MQVPENHIMLPEKHTQVVYCKEHYIYIPYSKKLSFAVACIEFYVALMVFRQCRTAVDPSWISQELCVLAPHNYCKGV